MMPELASIPLSIASSSSEMPNWRSSTYFCLLVTRPERLCYNTSQRPIHNSITKENIGKHYIIYIYAWPPLATFFKDNCKICQLSFICTWMVSMSWHCEYNMWQIAVANFRVNKDLAWKYNLDLQANFKNLLIKQIQKEVKYPIFPTNESLCHSCQVQLRPSVFFKMLLWAKKQKLLQILQYRIL